MSSLGTYAPYLCMIVSQLAYGGMNVLTKIAMQQGLSFHVFVAYRHLIAFATSIPLAYVLERKRRPPLSLLILVKIFFLSLIGNTLQQNVYFAGLSYTSPTVAGALSSVIPALTFAMALLLRMEKLRIKSAKGRAKVMGTLICISGALVFTFWKGHLLKGFVREPLIVSHGGQSVHGRELVKENWVKGSLLILTGYIAFSLWIVFQGVIFEAYPAIFSFNTLMCCFTSLQSSVVALIFERDKSSWQLGWNVQLVAIIYTGIVVSCLAYILIVYCTSQKGPVFSAIFSPLMLVIMAIYSAIFYAERLHLGSLIGAIIIIIGLYSVLWGKNEDKPTDKMEEKRDAEKELRTMTLNSTSRNGGHHV